MSYMRKSIEGRDGLDPPPPLGKRISFSLYKCTKIGLESHYKNIIIILLLPLYYPREIFSRSAHELVNYKYGLNIIINNILTSQFSSNNTC